MDPDTMMIITWFLVGVGVVSVCGTMYWCFKLYKYIRDPYFEYAVDETSPAEPPPHMYNTLKHNVMRRMANTLRRATKKKVQKSVKRDSACAVCLEPLNNAENSLHSSGETALGILKCGHIFHFECIWRWLRANFNCPVCRTQANMTVDDINVISLEAFEKAVATKSLQRYYKQKGGKTKLNKGVSKDSVSLAISTSGGESADTSPATSPGKNSNDNASGKFIILEGGHIGESDESLNVIPVIKTRPKSRPNVRNHKFKKKSEPDLHALSLTSLTSIPESDQDVGVISPSPTSPTALLPSFNHPVVKGKFTAQMETQQEQDGINDIHPQSGDDLNLSQSQASPSSPVESPGANTSSVFRFSKPSDRCSSSSDAKSYIGNYTPTVDQPFKFQISSQTNLWSSQISQLSDGLGSMLHLVQQQQQHDVMRNAIQEEILKMSSQDTIQVEPVVVLEESSMAASVEPTQKMAPMDTEKCGTVEDPVPTSNEQTQEFAALDTKQTNMAASSDENQEITTVDSVQTAASPELSQEVAPQVVVINPSKMAPLETFKNKTEATADSDCSDSEAGDAAVFQAVVEISSETNGATINGVSANWILKETM